MTQLKVSIRTKYNLDKFANTENGAKLVNMISQCLKATFRNYETELYVKQCEYEKQSEHRNVEVEVDLCKSLQNDFRSNYFPNVQTKIYNVLDAQIKSIGFMSYWTSGSWFVKPKKTLDVRKINMRHEKPYTLFSYPDKFIEHSIYPDAESEIREFEYLADAVNKIDKHRYLFQYKTGIFSKSKFIAPSVQLKMNIASVISGLPNIIKTYNKKFWRVYCYANESEFIINLFLGRNLDKYAGVTVNYIHFDEIRVNENGAFTKSLHLGNNHGDIYNNLKGLKIEQDEIILKRISD